MLKSYYTLLLTFCFGFFLKAQTDTTKDKIDVIHADLLNFEKRGDLEYQYLSQEVIIRHKKTYLFCDSAIIVGLSVRAIGHVRIVEGDSLQIFGDTLNYDGKKLKAELIDHVILNHHDKQLFTEKLYYDLKKRIASYNSDGLLISNQTKMKSKKAYYYAKTEQAFFKDSVNIILENGMNVQSDTIEFDSKVNKVIFLAPTNILRDSLNIYCEKGFYDVGLQYAFFDSYPIYKNKDQKAEAKIIINDEANKITNLIKDAHIRDSLSEAFGDTIIMNDQTHMVEIFGHGKYKDKDRTIEGSSIQYNRLDKSLHVLGRTQLHESNLNITAERIRYNGADDLGFAFENVVVKDTQSGWEIHCDTLSYNKKEKKYIPYGKLKYIATPLDNDTLYLTAEEISSEQKITGQDSFQILVANKDVRLWSKKIQGLCDSLFYHGKDSVFTMFRNPVMWSDTTQFTGDTIKIYMRNKGMDRIHLLTKAFILTESQTKLYNQIKGRNIYAYFKEKKVHKADIFGNAETIYFIQDDDKDYIGMNYIQCSQMQIDFLLNEKIDRIHFYNKPLGNLLPIFVGSSKRLEGYNSRLSEKPLNFVNLFE